MADLTMESLKERIEQRRRELAQESDATTNDQGFTFVANRSAIKALDEVLGWIVEARG